MLIAGVLTAAAQTPAPVVSGTATTCLIWPFENRSGDASLDWIGESFVIALRQGLRDTGVTVLTREQRDRALALTGIPAQVPLSHAGLIWVAGQVDARWLVVGWYDDDGTQLTAGASLIDLKREHLVTLAPEAGPLTSLETIQARLAWALHQQVDPGTATPPAASAPLPLRAYESYVRAELADSNAARLSDLDVAVHFAPADARILLALGEAQLGAQHEAEALQTLLKVAPTTAEYPEAQFNAGLAAFRLKQYPQAESIFAKLETQYPLPSVVADLALAKEGATASPMALKTDFPLESFLQLQRTVAGFNAARLQALAPGARVAAELQQGQRLLAQKAYDAAAQNFQRVLDAKVVVTSAQAAAAHTGLAAVWIARHNFVQARAEVAAALQAEPGNADARAVQDQLSSQPEALNEKTAH